MSVPPIRPFARTLLSGLLEPGDMPFSERQPLAGTGRRRAEFEDCTFDHCRIGHLYSVRADLVGCSFIGRVDNAQFLGADPASGVPNEIRDNDFTQAELGRVSFQGGARPASQVWAAGVAVDGDEVDWEIVVT